MSIRRAGSHRLAADLLVVASASASKSLELSLDRTVVPSLWDGRASAFHSALHDQAGPSFPDGERQRPCRTAAAGGGRPMPTAAKRAATKTRRPGVLPATNVCMGTISTDRGSGRRHRPQQGSRPTAAQRRRILSLTLQRRPAPPSLSRPLRNHLQAAPQPAGALGKPPGRSGGAAGPWMPPIHACSPSGPSAARGRPPWTASA